MRQKQFFLLGFLLALVSICLDRFTKYIAFINESDSHEIVNGFLWMKYQLNTDMALSLPLLPWLYYPATGLILVVLVGLLIRTIKKNNHLETYSIILVLVGAFSNLFDRIVYGGVIDFINLSIGNIFNLADVFIVGGVISWFVLSLYTDEEKVMLTKKKFQKVVEHFICKRCDVEVKGDGYTNHCTECFTSMHVDVNPGDRASDCHGLMSVKDVLLDHGNWVLLHQCDKCGHERKNKVADNDNQENLASLKEDLNRKVLNDLDS